MGLNNLRSDVEKDVSGLKSDIEQLDYKFDTYQKGTDGMVRMSTTIIIAAATIVILGSTLDKAEVLLDGMSRILGQ